jgi:hypothetical protein
MELPKVGNARMKIIVEIMKTIAVLACSPRRRLKSRTRREMLYIETSLWTNIVRKVLKVIGLDCIDVVT